MKKRHPVLVALLTCVTLGVYGLWWLAETRREMKKRHADGVPSVWILAMPLLVVLGLALIQLFVRAILGLANLAASGDNNTTIMVLNLVSAIFGSAAAFALLPLSLLWFLRYCQAAEKATKGGLSAGPYYILLICLCLVGLPLIWPGFMQAGFNRVARG